MYDFLKRINELKRTPRMGWLEGGVSQQEAEDVAQHSFETATITLVLVDSSRKKMDREKALLMAIVHDWAEALTGDFSKEVKDQIGLQAKEEIEEKAMNNLLEGMLQEKNRYLKIWKEYNEGKSTEAKLVKVADKLSILIEGRRLIKEGKNSEKIEKIWKKTRDELESYLDDFPTLEGLLRDLDADFSSVH